MLLVTTSMKSKRKTEEQERQTMDGREGNHELKRGIGQTEMAKAER